MSKCPICGVELINGYCAVCGYGLQHFRNNSNNIDQVDKNDMVKAFIGKNAEKLSTKNWNWSAFLLSPVYFVYRKLYKEFFVLLILIIALNFLMYYISIPFAAVLFSAILGLVFNKLYMKHVNKKVNAISANFYGKDAITECEKQGGVNKTVAYILWGINVIVVVVIISIGFSFPKVENSIDNEILKRTYCALGTCNSDRSECYYQDETGKIVWHGSCK